MKTQKVGSKKLGEEQKTLIIIIYFLTWLKQYKNY